MTENLQQTARHIQARVPETAPYAKYMQDEAIAKEILYYCGSLLPGPLQQPDVARSVTRAYRPHESDEAIDLIVASRQQRAAEIDAKRIQTTYFIDQRVLQAVPEATDWWSQVKHVAHVAMNDHVQVRIVPVGQFYPAQDMTTLLVLSNGRRAAYLESSISGDIYTYDPVITNRAGLMFRCLDSIALSAEASQIMLQNF